MRISDWSSDVCSSDLSRPAPAQAGGARPLDASRWFARLAQKIVALLGTVTAAGRLYDIDVRLRPDGGKGLLVSTLASYDEYPHHRPWTWETQALVRAPRSDARREGKEGVSTVRVWGSP